MIAEHVLALPPSACEVSGTGTASFSWKSVDDLSTQEIAEIEHLNRVSETAHPLQAPQFACFANAARPRPVVLLATDDRGLAGHWTGFFEQERGHPAWVYKIMFRSGPVLRDALQETITSNLLRRFVLAAEEAAIASGAMWQVVTSETVYGDAFSGMMPDHGYRLDDGWATYVIDLDRPLDDIWQSLDGKLRRSINTGRNRRVEVATSQDVSQLKSFAGMLSERLLEGEMPIPLPNDYAERCIALAEAAQAYTLIAQHEGRIVGGKLEIAQGPLVISFQTVASRGSLRVGDLLAWEEIAHAHARGARSLDLLGIRMDAGAGSRQDGIRSFKEKFGGRMVPTPVFARRLPVRGIKGLAVSTARLLRGRHPFARVRA
jgi:hypothetical protein